MTSRSRPRRSRMRPAPSPACRRWRATSPSASGARRHGGRARRATARSSSTRPTASSLPIARATTSTPIRACAGCSAIPATSSSGCTPRTSSPPEEVAAHRAGVARDRRRVRLPPGVAVPAQGWVGLRGGSDRDRDARRQPAGDDPRRHRAESGRRGAANGGRAHAVCAAERRRRDLGHGLHHRRAPMVRDPRSPVRPAARHVWRDLRGVRRAHSSRRSGVRARDDRERHEGWRRFHGAAPIDLARRHGAVAERRGPHPPRRARRTGARRRDFPRRHRAPHAGGSSFSRRRRWKPSDGWPAASRTTSTIC